MAVVTVQHVIEVPKEGKELIDAVASLISHFVNKKSLAEAGALLPELLKAVDGFGLVAEEIKSQYKDELAAYSLEKIWESLEVKA